jgi:hypothetical protein
MIVTVFDTESNGFLKDSKKAKAATRLWCIAAIDKTHLWEHDDVALYTPHLIQGGLARLNKADVLVCHNLKKHDLPLMKKLHGWEPASHQVIVDTLTFSRMLNPKRPLPEGYKGNKTHSLEAWGYRVGLAKPEHEDWMQWSDDMGTRCCLDAVINLLTLEELEREAGNLSSYYELLNDSLSTET